MNPSIAVVGLGYVGLPVAVALAATTDVMGFDVSCNRIEELLLSHDSTAEFSRDELMQITRLTYSCDPTRLATIKRFVVCVPTPIKADKSPDLAPLKSACRTIGPHLTPGALVVFESTVYPGVTEDVCGPILEQASGLKVNEDFWLGYSPERINPGDKSHRLKDIVKVVSGSSELALEMVANLYEPIIDAGLHRAPSIRVAEAAKVIENTQRDLNIGLMNEFAKILDRLGIDTHDVLDAASTKWNFQRFQPGLVGGHCIGVDPYYLTFAARSVGYEPEVIEAGRSVNDSMSHFLSEIVTNRLREMELNEVDVLILGVTFKENCPDTRNSLALQLVHELSLDRIRVYVSDPWLTAAHGPELLPEGASWIPWEALSASEGGFKFDGVVVAVAHTEFTRFGSRVRDLIRDSGQIFDVKGVLPREAVDFRL